MSGVPGNRGPQISPEKMNDVSYQAPRGIQSAIPGPAWFCGSWIAEQGCPAPPAHETIGFSPTHRFFDLCSNITFASAYSVARSKLGVLSGAISLKPTYMMQSK